ncbi:hypothetical protein ACH4Y0_00005 [Streptomyces sp. NPDC020707]
MDPELHVPDQRPYDADSPLAHLMEIVAAAVDEVPEEVERDAAETTAAHLVFDAYPYTLGQVVDPDTWQGYPAVRRFEAAAVAPLGGGL